MVASGAEALADDEADADADPEALGLGVGEVVSARASPGRASVRASAHTSAALVGFVRWSTPGTAPHTAVVLQPV